MATKFKPAQAMTKRRNEVLTAKRRSEIARQGATAKWRLYREAKAAKQPPVGKIGAPVAGLLNEAAI